MHCLEPKCFRIGVLSLSRYTQERLSRRTSSSDDGANDPPTCSIQHSGSSVSNVGPFKSSAPASTGSTFYVPSGEIRLSSAVVTPEQVMTKLEAIEKRLEQMEAAASAKAGKE